MKEKQRLQIFNSIYPTSSVADELLNCDLKEFHACSYKELLKLINKVITKISFTIKTN